MKIETKYSIKDTVFFLYDNKIHRGWIKRITIGVQNNTCNEMYDVQISMPQEKEIFGLNADVLFRTKEALVERLLSDYFV